MQRVLEFLIQTRMIAAVLRLALLVSVTSICYGDPVTSGKWGEVIPLPNVAIHTHVLPNGKVFFWGRRLPGNPDLDVHDSQTWLLDPSNPSSVQQLPGPKDQHGQSYNPFCSGHTFLADGRLLVAGGHIKDSVGSPNASTFNANTLTWSPVDAMGDGRWYPTVVALANGWAVVTSGSETGSTVNAIQQVLDLSTMHWLHRGTFDGLPLYPRMFLNRDGRVFMTGWFHSLDNNPDKFEGAFLLDTANGDWSRLDAPHRAPLRDYFPSVVYEPGKVAVFGGGDPPVSAVEIIDLNASAPTWTDAGSMKSRRRQHNATILPDGTVLITGGTQGGGFNNLGAGMPVHTAELWNPKRIGKPDEWTVLAAEDVDRCYHATAVLLPDATVLSAGGGEYRPDGNGPNPPQDSHKDAQIFSPPYLFRNQLPRPAIDSAPDVVTYGQTFEVKLSSDVGEVGQVNWVRLSSVTHSFNQNQRINFLSFANAGGHLQVTAPDKPEICPPGHYLLFVLNSVGTPSAAKVVQIK